MTPQSPTGGHRRLSKAAVLGLGLVLAALFFGCGRMPPEPWWEPTSEDSAAIDALVQANKAMFRQAFTEGALAYADTSLPGTTATRLQSEIDDIPYRPRFRCDSIEHRFFTDSFDLQYTFIAGLDTTEQETTATVTMAETIPGILRMHAYAYTRYLGDTVIIEPPDTIVLPVYDSVFSDTSMYVEKRFWGQSVDGMVFKKENGEWKLWKYGGGSRFYAPSPDEAPYLASCDIADPDTTITIQLRPDTTQYGIQRFYAESELPTYHVGDSISVSSVLTTVLDAANYSFLNHVRHEFSAADKIPLDQPGVFRLFVEQIPIEVLYEQSGDAVMLVWGVTIKVE